MIAVYPSICCYVMDLRLVGLMGQSVDAGCMLLSTEIKSHEKF
jgi:hypothetical protein